jgi:hypothetical protein
VKLKLMQREKVEKRLKQAKSGIGGQFKGLEYP